MRKIIFLIWVGACIFFMGSVTGCILETEKDDENCAVEKIRVEFPKVEEFLGEDWGKIEFWETEITDCKGSVRKKVYGNEMEMTVLKNSPCGIEARPVFVMEEDGEKLMFFEPCGALYPFDFEEGDGRVEMTWPGGFTADIFLRMVNASLESGYGWEEISEYAGKINWRKFNETLKDKSESGGGEKAFYNPWQLDSQVILNYLSSGNFSASYLNLKKAFVIEKNQMFGEYRVFSAYVPENKNILDSGKISLIKDKSSFYIVDKKEMGVITGSSEKNILTEYISLPIYRER